MRDLCGQVKDNPAFADLQHNLDLLQTIVLALIQGVTEFLPISSTAHLVLASDLIGWPDQGIRFDIAVHLGSLLAVLVRFRQDCLAIVGSVWQYARWRQRDDTLDLLLKLLLATLPVAMLGAVLPTQALEDLRTSAVIAAATSVFALFLWWANAQGGKAVRTGWRHACWIGLAQSLALIPGASRSGVAITAALLVGLSRPAAARFALLLGIPVIAGAVLFDAVSVATTNAAPTPASWQDLALGAAISGLSAYFCISLFLASIQRVGLMPFVYYRLALGGILFLLLL